MTAQRKPVPDLAEVARRSLPAYGFGPDSTVTRLDLSENATYKVADRDRSVVLRVHRLGYHTPIEVISELDWLAALAEQTAVRTPAIIKTVSGDRMVTVNTGEAEPRMCVAFEFLPGAAPAADRLVDNFGVLGAITARMHRHVRDWPRPAGFTRFAWDVDAAFGAHPRWGSWRAAPGIGPAEVDVLQRLEACLVRRLADYGSGPDRYGLIHADLRLANLLVDGDRIAVIDFDDCGSGWYLYDLAAALSFIEHEPVVPELVARWLAGYRSVAELPARDEAEIWTFILLRRMLLTAWIGSHRAVEFARSLGAGYTAGTCALADRFLSTHA